MSEKARKSYRTTRAKLIAAGYTLASWAKLKGYPVTTVHGAARGLRNGVKATQIRRELEEFVR